MFKKLDLRGTPCPVNFVRCRLAIENLDCGQTLEVDIDRGEPEKMVISGLKEEGHNIQIIFEDNYSLKFLITPNAIR